MTNFPAHSLVQMLEAALSARLHLLDARHECAVRLFNGFYEGEPDLVIDIYARTLLIFNHAEDPEQAHESIQAAQEFFLSQFPWIQAIVLKARHSPALEARRGLVVYGEKPDERIREHGVWYAIDLLLSQDAGLYLDTRGLRLWAIQNLAGKTVLNTFAYTGSLGVAATAGDASRVIHLDRSRKFLNVAKASYTLNGFPIHKPDFQSIDFWTQTSRMRRQGQRFDCVFLDPPFFSLTSKGRVDLVTGSARLVNKARPLVNPSGYLVVVNNALFVSGTEFMKALEGLCAGGYLSIEALIPVSPDVVGYPHTIRRHPPADPAPFNHSTKIVILRVK